MTLSNWIIRTGPKNVAKILNVDPGTVSQWKRKKSCPRPALLVKINKLSRGEVTYKSMLESFVSSKK
jgi:hypothetical protein